MPPTGKKTTSTPAHSEDHEIFDLNVSDTEQDRESDVRMITRQRQASRIQARPQATGSIPSRSVDSTDSQAAKSAALDIVYFFSSKTGKSRHCVVCKAAFDALQNPAEWPPSRTYNYSTSTSNTGLRGHLDKFHKEEYIKLAEERGWTTTLPSIKRELALKMVTPAKTPKPMFSVEAVTQRLVRFIAANDQSLNVVENPEFRNLLTFFREDYGDEDMPHRSKIRVAIIETWQAWFLQLKDELKNSVGAPQFTTDIWSNRRRQSYICVTVHWIAYERPAEKQDIVLKSSLLAFQQITGKHTGKRLAEVVFKLLQRAEINGVEGSHWTMDMAANNDVFLRSLGDLYKEKLPDVSFDPKESRIQCFPHVINTCVQHTIKALLQDNTASNSESDSDADNKLENMETQDGESNNKESGKVDGEDLAEESSGEDSEESDSESDSESSDDDSDEDVATSKVPSLGDPINKIRALVRGIRASGQRQEQFNNVILGGNQYGWWKDGQGEAMSIKPKQLLRDVRTRWDSTYQMLVRAREFRQPLDNYLNMPEAKELQKYKLSIAEWDQITNIIGVLQFPHVVQQVMSKEKTPVLAGTIPSFERFMTSWEKLAKKPENKHLAPAIKVGLKFAYKYYKKMDDTIAYVLAMLLHPGIRTSWMREHWEAKYFKKAEIALKKMAAPKGKMSLGYVNLGLPSNLNLTEEDELNWVETSFETQTVDAEYSAYGFGVLTKLDVNILKYWEMHKEDYPTLFAIAMDYLPIQASSVPCERTFSSSAETDTVRRNRISPLLMEALQMLKFGFRNEPFNFTEGLITDERDMVIPLEFENDLLAELVNPANTEAQREDIIDRVVMALGE